ncbi:hypothetical protein [Paraburkholderia sp. MM5477-R1]|uniref:hypothetical protein n=1 Tax=Paraburkholderia sp. MM5477-R1 TaxID=2991062 RepID=UPI003D1B1BDD
MFEESFRYATASFRGSTQHFTGPGEACAKTGVCPRIAACHGYEATTGKKSAPIMLFAFL